MPAIQIPPPAESASAEAASAARATRFDPPHEIPRAEPATGKSSMSLQDVSRAGIDLQFEAPVAVLASQSEETLTPALVRQFRTQAQQLAGHLQSRQRELDHRESELHTQLARHEAAARSARLWFQEQHRKLTQRQSEWERREREICAGLRSAGGTLAALTASDRTAVGSDDLSSIDGEIEFQMQTAELYERSAQLEARYHQSESLEKKLEAREQIIEAAETRLARNEAELQFARQELHAEREAFAARVERQQRQAEANRARQELELAQRRAHLDEQASRIEKRAVAVDQLRSELLLTQRDVIESQLAAEELRAEIAGQVPPAAIVQSLARLRAKLSEQYRLQVEEVERVRTDIDAQAAHAAQQQRQVVERNREFDLWMASQHRQIEEQASQLAAREEQLERQQNERENRCLQQAAERRELEAEIRRLHGHLRRLEQNALELC
jgi:hypothetical protein